MDQSIMSGGLAHLVTSRSPQSLVEWNAEYEALSVRHDWWFKAAVAVTAWVRSTVAAMAAPTSPVPQLALA